MRDITPPSYAIRFHTECDGQMLLFCYSVWTDLAN
jgi:hypothetical protein